MISSVRNHRSQQLRRYAAVAVLLLVAVALSGCWPFSSDLDKANAAIDAAISRLENQSVAWQAELDKLLSSLPEKYQQAKSDVTQLLMGGLQATGTESKCSMQFVGQMTLDSLKDIKSDLAKQPRAAHEPATCTTNPPGDIELAKIKSGAVHELDIDGYFLDLSAGLGLGLLDSSGVVQKIDPKYIGNPSHYMLNVNLERYSERLHPQVR